jgi:hypothetical protein
VKRKRQWDATLTGWPQWVRLPWLRGIYWPFWWNVYAIKRAARAWRGRVNLVTDEELMELTAPLDEHWEGWHHPCACALCRSYS